MGRVIPMDLESRDRPYTMPDRYPISEAHVGVTIRRGQRLRLWGIAGGTLCETAKCVSGYAIGWSRAVSGAPLSFGNAFRIELEPGEYELSVGFRYWDPMVEVTIVSTENKTVTHRFEAGRKYTIEIERDVAAPSRVASRAGPWKPVVVDWEDRT